MDFDLDDPLGSDDSFFEEPKVLAKRSSFTKTPEKKSIENLLGFDTKTKSSVSTEDIKKSETSNKKQMDDWLTDVKGPSTTDRSRRSDFLDDILPIKPKTTKHDKKGTSLEDILKESKVTTTPKTAQSLKDVNPEPTVSSEYGISSTISDRRRSGRRGSGVEDTLGLFRDTFVDKKETIPKSTETLQKTSAGININPSDKNTTFPGVPDWLGLSSTNVKRSDSPVTVNKSAPNINNENVVVPKEVDVADEIENKIFVDKLVPQDINAGIQNSYTALHQQESLLLVSIQFKKYEEVLKDIQEKQNFILGQQERQFKNFIDDYILKQHAVENNIKLQQERINNQIKLLVTDHVDKLQSDTDVNDDKKEEDLKDLLSKLKQRHDEELFIMEESYKKQMDMVEKSAANVEENVQKELKNLEDLYDKKLQNFKTNYDEEISYYKEKIKILEEQYKNEIKIIKDVHAEKIDELKSEHAVQIDYIKQMKTKEDNLLREGHELSQKIDTGINILGNNLQILQGIEDKVIKNYDVLALAREQSIQAKEKEIIMMKKCLEKCRESAENERSQLLSLIRNLELKLAEQNTNAQEDRWALQQATATLTARCKAIEREAEYGRNIIEREREQLKTLKETLLGEQEKMVMQLTEEKLQLASEKSKLETSAKISNSYEVERVKIEAETAIKEAKCLSERLNRERALLQREKIELNALKQNLMERERELEDKESEMEFLVQDTQKKLKEDKQVLSEAKRMEATYKEKLKELQAQWVLLSNREKKLAEDKILLSRERLALYTSLKASKDCVLCSAGGGDSTLGKNQILTAFDNIKSPDPTATRIRLEALDDEDSEVSKEESVNK
ncbi:fas-binding factor 1-like [Diorhabda carinulata]|uniref:fas-binding factor 1-like n=1 Tax=Diorhabda carinulata TaxID=1163345 RepID=UPI0025A29CE3|nr:fas-binding factor 1-like [Diorhabda carinulata]